MNTRLPISDKKYEKKWVALTPDNKRIIAYAADAKKLSEKLEKMKVGKREAVMLYVRPFDSYYAPKSAKH